MLGSNGPRESPSLRLVFAADIIATSCRGVVVCGPSIGSLGLPPYEDAQTNETQATTTNHNVDPPGAELPLTSILQRTEASGNHRDGGQETKEAETENCAASLPRCATRTDPEAFHVATRFIVERAATPTASTFPIAPQSSQTGAAKKRRKSHEDGEEDSPDEELAYSISVHRNKVGCCLTDRASAAGATRAGARAPAGLRCGRAHKGNSTLTRGARQLQAHVRQLAH